MNTQASSRRPRIGLALGAGGARGWCHVGVVSALAEMGVQPDVIAGCSMGAFVGAAVAGDRLEALETWGHELTALRVLNYIDMRLTGGGLVGGQQIARLLEEVGLPEKIEELRLPFATVATDLQTGEELWLRSGPLVPAVRGSLSIPGVFRPYPHDGRWLVDGALCDPVPVAPARALGAQVVIAIDPNATAGRPLWEAVRAESLGLALIGRAAQAEVLPERLRTLLMPQREEGAEDEPVPPGYLEVVSTSLDIMQTTILRQRLAADPPEVFLEADLRDVGILELHRAEEAIAHGRELVEAAANDIEAALSGRQPA